MVNQKLSIVCRPACQEDTAQALALAALIWEGDDYIPYVWEKWLTDRYGLLAVAECQGRIVGLGKLTRHSPGSWWMEGLRTHPEFEGRGIASQIFRYLQYTWQRTGDGILRLATHSENLPIHHICERNGFQRLGELIIYKALPLDQACHTFQPVTAGEMPSVLARLKSSQLFHENLRLLDIGWTWTDPAPEIIQPTLEKGLAWWWQAADEQVPMGLVLVILDPEANEATAQWVIQGLDCPPERLSDLLLDIRRLAFAEAGRTVSRTVSWNLANRPELIQAAEAAGYQRAWDLSLYIYTLSHWDFV
jgi:RimJ/RimL family protein N-acetyltransferase